MEAICCISCHCGVRPKTIKLLYPEQRNKRRCGTFQGPINSLNFCELDGNASISRSGRFNFFFFQLWTGIISPQLQQINATERNGSNEGNFALQHLSADDVHSGKHGYLHRFFSRSCLSWSPSPVYWWGRSWDNVCYILALFVFW